MEKLIEANLYHSELVPIGGALVSRYNQCLVRLGFKPTKLKTFQVDGIGWSPEIAEEKEDIGYLNNGDANPHAIIVSPQQRGKPVYYPFHTFDRNIMKMVFKTYGDHISDITRDGALCIDLDQDIDAFYEPLDILKYKDITVGFRILNDLDRAQKEQEELVSIFNEDTNFIDESLHMKILASARKYGDLRSRKLQLAPLTYTSGSFFTRAFGGVFVLRDFITSIVVFKDKKAYKKAIKDSYHEVLIYHVDQKELVQKLQEHVILVYDLEEAIKTDRYQRIKKFMFYEVLHELEEKQHPVSDILKDKMLFRSYFNKIEDKNRARLASVERYVEKLEISNELKIDTFVDKDFFHALQKPHSSLTGEHQDLIWMLLAEISAKDPLHLYWYQKERFYEEYQQWDSSFRDWVIDIIKSNI
ncbi:DUF6638 family protein [Spongiivirga citrea]|uniref:Uncharacterized protein n=1 Tax=Spongiivirga citrea TaxID=1481457 RepID=A0A6M0CL04_9FLAO|nr:DUF6638 family protein [Spongiivirga citrea]NER16674.1 hypothetical protein [Spongiivirga citrea]